MRKLLIHTCCAPCFAYIEKDISENGILNNEGILEKVEFSACWHNQNIHPKVEYERRKNTLIDFSKKKDFDLVILDEYNLNEYITNVVNLTGTDKEYISRCEYCYTIRLEKVFAYAKENGYNMVSTTLSISPYQNHELIQKVGKKLQEKYDIEFIYVDYREHFREGQKLAREYNLYMQKYCGCVFSFDDGKWVY